MARDSFIFYRDWFEAAQSIEDGANRLTFYEALASYALNGQKIPTPPEVSGFLFQPYKQIERDMDKWESTKRSRSEAGKLHTGNQYTRKKSEQNGTNGTSVPKMEQMNQNGTNGTVNVNVNDNVNINNNINNTPPTPPLRGNEDEGGWFRLIEGQKKAMANMCLFEGRRDEADGAAILRFTTDPYIQLRFIADFPKDKPLYELRQRFESAEKAGDINPMSYKDWTTAAYINDTFSLLSLKKLSRVLNSEESWEVTKEAVADCKKGGIKFPDRYILAKIRELEG